MMGIGKIGFRMLLCGMRSVTLMLVFCVCGAWADVETGKMALEDGFYALADQAFLDVLDEKESSDTALAAHYVLRSHYEQKRLDRLGEDLERFASEGILGPDAVAYWRGVRLVGLQQWRAADETLAVFLDDDALADSVYLLSALRLKALTSFQQGYHDATSALFETLDTRINDDLSRAINRLDWGRALLAAGEFEAAKTVWEPLLIVTNLPPSLASQVSYWASRAFLLSDEAPRAVALLRPLLDQESLAEPVRVRVSAALAEGMRLTGDIEGGVTVLTNTLEHVRNPVLSVQMAYEIANYLLEADRLDAARERVFAFAATFPDEPLAPRVMRRLGETLLHASREADAAEVFQRYLEAFGDKTGEIYLAKAMALMGQQHPGEAALLFERAADLLDDKEAANAARIRAADSYFENHQYRLALNMYQRVKRELEASDVPSERMPKVMFQCAASLAALGENQAAINAFEALVAAFPEHNENADARVAIGDLYVALNELDAAEMTFENVMQRWPDKDVYWRALHGRGMVRYHRWAPNAIDDFERIAAEAAGTPMGEHAQFMRAMCLYRLGRDEQALTMCLDFLTRFPSSEWTAPVQFWVGRLQYNAGDDEAAEKTFQAFVEAYPAHALAPQALLRSGLAALRRLQYLTAIERFGQMAKQYPASELLADARFYQAEAMVELGRFAAAILVYEEVINNYPERELAVMAMGRKGDCQFTLGAEESSRYNEALLTYQGLLKTPELVLDTQLQAAYKCGLVLEKLKRDEEALEQYYSGVMLPFLLEKRNGGIPGEAARVWFSRAARAAAEIAEKQEDWRRVVRILERASGADVEFSAEARNRIKQVKSDYWWMFY